FAAILAVPLAFMPWRVTQLAWAALAYLALAITVWFAFRSLLTRFGRAAGYLPAAFGAIVGICLFLWPMLQQIRVGQVDIVLAARCVAALAAVRPRTPRGLLIGLATAIKLTPGLFIIYLLLTGRRRAAALASGVAVACAAGAWALLPGGSAYYW